MKGTFLFFFSIFFQNILFSQCSQDITPPNAICQNQVVYLDSSGIAIIQSSDLDGGSNDNCGSILFNASDSVFDCQSLGINYLTLFVSDNATLELIDQQNISSPTYSAWDQVGQSFTPAISGELVKIELKTGFNFNQYSTLQILQGNGVNGAVLSSQTVDMIAFDAVVINVISLVNPINVISGQSYTILLKDNFGQITGVDMTSNPYLGGTAYVNSSPIPAYDLYFKTFIKLTSNNTDSCTAIVTVLDTISPVPLNSNLNAISGCKGDQITPNIPEAIDNCSGQIFGVSNLSFPITADGLSTIIWSFVDASGNTTTQAQNIFIQSIDTDVTQINSDLYVDQDNAQYQWLDCDNELINIPGETNQLFSPINQGNYAVQVVYNGCTDTSNCIFFLDNLSIDEISYNDRTILGYFNLMGQEINFIRNTPIFIKYSDGTVERIFMSE